MPSFYDWATEERSADHTLAPSEPPAVPANTDSWNSPGAGRRGGEVVIREEKGAAVNPVTGHALDCACSRCPGWYAARAAAAVAAERWGTAPVVVPPKREPRPLTDQVVPVAVLMVVFTTCMVVLLPVVTPILALTSMALVAMVIAVVALATVLLVFLGVIHRARSSFGTQVITQPQRSRWLRRR